MNPQYGGPVGAPGSFGPPLYKQPSPQSPYNNYEMQGGGPGPYSNAGTQNGPGSHFPGQNCNQSNSQVQSASVPPSHMINNQMAHDFNALHLSQNQNHPLLTNMQPNHRLPNSAPQLPLSQGSNMPSQQQYWQQNQPRMPPPPSGHPDNNVKNMPPNSFVNARASPYPPPETSMPPAPHNSAYPHMMQHTERTLPPHSSEALNQPLMPKMPSADMNNSSNQQYPPQRQPAPYVNGTAENGPAYALNNQYPPHSNSNMHARYPPASSSPSPASGNHMGTSGSQFGQQNNSYPPQNNSYPPQNRVGSLPQPPAQTRRLDPDHMPSPIQVIEDDQKTRSCPFSTAQRGLVPPLVTTNFTVTDDGFCSPRYIRSTIYNVPTTADMLKQTNVPFSLIVSPLALPHVDEHHPPIVNPGEEGPVRCHRCRAYMSPFMQFIDAGRRFQCMLCRTTTEVPAHYFTHLDHMGERVDKLERAELCLGSYEFLVNKDYCKDGKLPNCPAFVFVIDVSYNSVKSGMVKTLCGNMKKILSRLPRDYGASESNLRVGFITYSSVIHFYNISSNLAQPQMLVVSDVNDMFMPLLDGFLVQPSESEQVISSLLEQIPVMFAETKETETVFGPAIQAGLEALKAAECAGKLFAFHTSLPIAEAPGKLKNRDDRKLLGTEKEKTILSPQSPFYNNLGQECVKAGCSVDLFLFNNAYVDVATLGQVCRLTGGNLFKYTYFQADIDGERFIEDLCRDVERPIAFDAVLRVRTSTGVRPTDFYGSFFMSNTTDVELASISCDSSLAIEIKYDDKLTEEDGVCIQCAVLYTSCSGQRRLRVHNLGLNTCAQMADLFRNCELDTILNFFLKESVQKITEEAPKQIKDYLITRAAQILACYRKNCAQASSAGQLILPECMKLLPLYINCLIKCDALSGGQEMTTDDRSFIMLTALSMDVESSAAYLYPRLIPLHEMQPNPEQCELPVSVRCSLERLKDHGIYLLENGLNLFIWIGMNADSTWIQNIFGKPSVAHIDVEKTLAKPLGYRESNLDICRAFSIEKVLLLWLPELVPSEDPCLLPLNNPISQCVDMVIKQIQSERHRQMKLFIVRQGDRLELLFRQHLVEDRTTDGSVSYVDFLCHLHKEIRTLLS